MGLGDPYRPSSLTPAISFGRWVMLIGRRRDLTETTFQLGEVLGGGMGMALRTCLTTSFTALTTLRVAWNKHN